MAGFLGNIPGNIMGAGRGFVNTITLAGEKFSETTLWQRTGGVAVPFLQDAASYWPQPLQFRVFSKETAGGFALAMLVGATINKVKG